tara:strand:+ start:3993 stop:4337 length:345 start_codon:yes stop_codon:yes gene_type:complete
LSKSILKNKSFVIDICVYEDIIREFTYYYGNNPNYLNVYKVSIEDKLLKFAEEIAKIYGKDGIIAPNNNVIFTRNNYIFKQGINIKYFGLSTYIYDIILHIICISIIISFIVSF